MFITLGIITLFGFGCISNSEKTDVSVVIDRDAILFEAKENGLIMNDEEIQKMAATNVNLDEMLKEADKDAMKLNDFSKWLAAALADVTGGDSYGMAHMRFENNTYSMIAEMGNLPILQDDYFYEGWIVKRGEQMSVISTGKAEFDGEVHLSAYQSKQDLSDYDFFVLTLEPNDGDPAPAEHILEGMFK